MDLKALVGAVGEELSAKVAEISDGLLVQITVGSRAAGARVAGMHGLSGSLEEGVTEDDFWNFPKAGDGFIRVWGQEPPNIV
jgi:hypothetical protein